MTWPPAGRELYEEALLIEVQQVRELIELMVEHGLTEIRLKEGETTISLRKGPLGEVTMFAPQSPPLMHAPAGPAAPAAPAGGPVAGEAPKQEDEGLIAINSPMVGTCYLTPDPESPPFIRAGLTVDEQTTICIIEAMKVFNEIKAEINGTVERVVVQNGQAVEFGQPLMLVRPRK
jgi:acetyl-CoA carboxylase biotin carboxyl carrier protein